MATTARTIYFMKESAKTMLQAPQISIIVCVNAMSYVQWKAINANGRMHRANTAGSGRDVAFGAPFSLALWRVVAPHR